MNSNKRPIAVSFIVLFLFQVWTPTIMFALTDGPGQPEYSSFQPIGADNMVDLFSGDFNYNIPLMNVPGPDGGYPINIHYNSNVGMESEASWVGLGWNLNLGSVTRSMSGLPDDFNGVPVLKKNNMKTNFNVAIDIKSEKEGLSIQVDDCITLNTQRRLKMYFDNYQGLGITAGVNTSIKKASLDIGLNLSTHDGISVNPTFQHGLFGAPFLFRSGTSINSKHGIQNFNFSIIGFTYLRRSGTFMASSSFAMSYLPSAKVGTTTINGRYGLKVEDFTSFGNLVSLPFVADKGVFAGEASRTFIKGQYKERVYKGYGYRFSQNTALHQGDNVGDSEIKNELLDFNLENEGLNPKNAPNAPNVLPANDAYSASGHGFSGLYTPYRNDHGYYYSPEVKSENYGGTFTLDTKFKGKSNDLGAEVGLTYSDSYSGPISDSNFAPNSKITFNENYRSKEGTFYKEVGGHNTIQDPSISKSDDQPYRFKTPNFLGGAIVAKVEDKLLGDEYGNPSSVTDFTDKTREQSNVVLKSFSCEELETNVLISPVTVDGVTNFDYLEKSSYNGYPNTQTATDFNNYESNDLTGAFVGHSSNGMKYEYGVPVYNNYQKEAVFSTDVDDNTSKVIDYNMDENSLENSAGVDHFYQSTELPPYAYSHLLTGIFSPDYVDVSNDGPSEDDLGYYVKFDYTKTSGDYQWRAPFVGANNMPNNLSDNRDNKANIMFGSKEIYYVKQVETKTHKAEFVISARLDGKEAFEEDQLGNDGVADMGTESLYRLDEIRLYSKLDNSTEPIQVVHFDYDYSLCSGTLNSMAPNQGKLTLTKIHTTYYGNEKGKLSPYTFAYSEPNNTPSYNTEQIDHWGTYKPEGSSYDAYYGSNLQNPYTNQTDVYSTTRNNNVSAWLLKNITLPSGGSLSVEYESDDYGFVQNKKAQQLYKVVGLTKGANHGALTSTQIAYGSSKEMKGTNPTQFHWVHVEIPESSTITDQNEAIAYRDRMLGDIEDIYFKIYMELKFPVLDASSKAKDYVNGYAVLDDEALQADPYLRGDKWYVAIPVKNHYDTKHHPFRVEGINKLRYERSDLFRNNNGAAVELHTVIAQTLSLIPEFLSLVTGFINAGIAKSWCKNAELTSDNFPSFIRLNDGNGIKYGGGHRVNSITVNDDWKSFDSQESTSSYVLNYDYTLEDGTSSGVACYEPRIGGEENALKSVKRYYGNYLGNALNSNAKHKWLEHPVNANYFPSAQIGYSRVVAHSTGSVETQDDVYITSLDQEDRLKSAQIVNEFYTCKDFPTKVRQTDYNIVKQIPPIIPIPCVGTITMNNSMISQGYSIELNDMHGKPKSIKTFHSTADITDLETVPYAKTEYVYKTNDQGLDNTVRFYHPDQGSLEAVTGRSVEMATYMNVNRTIGGSMKGDVDLQAELPLIIPSGWLPTDAHQIATRTVTTNKIIRKQGIIDKVITKVADSYVEAKNVAFDKKTGSPVVVQKTNNYEDPIYVCSIPAHWEYSDFGDAKSTIGYKDNFENSDILLESDRITFSSMSEPDFLNFPIEEGDLIKLTSFVIDEDESSLCSSDLAYVNEVVRDEQNFEISLILKDKNGNEVENFSCFNSDCIDGIGNQDETDWKIEVEIIETNRNNMLGVNSGSIITLNNPIEYGLLGSNWLTDLNGAIQSIGNFDQDNPTNAKIRLTTGSLCSEKYQYDGIIEITESSFIIEISVIDIADPNNTIDINLEFAGTENYSQAPGQGSVLILTPEHNFSNTYIEISENGTEFIIVENQNDVNGQQFFGSDLNGTDPQTLLDFFGDDCEGEVLAVSAATFSDDWDYYYTNSDLTQANAEGNPYRYGRKGNYRLEDSYVYQTQRTQSEGLDLSKDGTFSYTPFTWSQTEQVDEDDLNLEWTNTSTMTMYDAFNNALESTNPLDIRSTNLFNRDGNYLIASCVNAYHHEIAFEDFEDMSIGTGYTPGNRFDLIGISNLTETASHSGSNCASLNAGASIQLNYTNVSPDESYFYPRYEENNEDKRYVLSFWVKTDDFSDLNISYSGSSTLREIADEQVIEGWQKVDLILEEINFTSFGTISIQNQSGVAVLFDDFRIHPYESGFTSSVYDYENTRLVSSLDNQNYATFYNYDQEGSLIQTKQETTRGIVTIQTGRSNIKK